MSDAARRRLLVFWSFAAIYVIWGSTYLAIRVAVEVLPPFLMAGVRFLLAGVALYLWSRRRGVAAPTWDQWRAAGVLGSLFFLVGNGGIVWAETRVPSGLTALLAATTPLWTLLFESARDRWRRPPGRVAGGVILGLAGVALLVAPGELLGGEHVDPLGAAAITLAALGWAAGSVTSHRLHPHPSLAMATAMKMVTGGVALLAAGLLAGEAERFHPAEVTLEAVAAWIYLVLFGSLVAFSAFTYLLRVTTPARVSTSAYVNPLVAVALGWAFLGEAVPGRTLVAGLVIVAGVVLIRWVSEEPEGS